MGLNNPMLAPSKPFISAVKKRPVAKFPVLLETVGGVGNDQIRAAIRELSQELRCVAEMDGVVQDLSGG